MTVAEFIAEIRTEGAKQPFIARVSVLDETDYATKLQLIVRSDLFVQVYANVQSGTRGYAVIYRGQRIYGRDCDNQRWHLHTAANPRDHDLSAEGHREVSIGEFLREVADLLEEQELL